MKKKAPTCRFPASAERIRAHWRRLCRDIGERRAGSAGDRAAADYILGHLRRTGLENVHAEAFPCVSVVQADAEVAIGTRQRLRAVPARVLAGAPGTPRSRSVEGELVWIEMPEQADRMFQPSLRGKIAILFGPMPTRADLHQRLVQCAPAAVLHVDDRLPFEWLKDDGVYPVWAARYGMPPTLTIPYRAAWDLRKQGADWAKACAKVRLKATTSHNLVGEIRGQRADLPMVLLGAHHDTQCHNTGADDNASGVVGLLELAELLKALRPLRTIRLVSFGAEEQLSVGAAQYVTAHRREMSGMGVVLNLDSVSSPLGHHWIFRAGTARFGAWLTRSLAKSGLDVIQRTTVMPFADQFPFSVFGVPAVTFMRPNMDTGMRWQHHSEQDDLDNVSVEELARVVQALAATISHLVHQESWPFTRGLTPEQRAETIRMGKELFGF